MGVEVDSGGNTIKKPRVTVTKKSDTGKNIRFKDNKTNQEMTQNQFVKKIVKKVDGLDEPFYTRKINGVLTPCAKPNSNKKDNLD